MKHLGQEYIEHSSDRMKNYSCHLNLSLHLAIVDISGFHIMQNSGSSDCVRKSIVFGPLTETELTIIFIWKRKRNEAQKSIAN